jgi:hypothetical protein
MGVIMNSFLIFTQACISPKQSRFSSKETVPKESRCFLTIQEQFTVAIFTFKVAVRENVNCFWRKKKHFLKKSYEGYIWKAVAWISAFLVHLFAKYSWNYQTGSGSNPWAQYMKKRVVGICHKLIKQSNIVLYTGFSYGILKVKDGSGFKEVQKRRIRYARIYLDLEGQT